MKDMDMTRWARGRTQPVRGQQNKLEKEYEDYLFFLKANGDITTYAFEPMKLRLADRTFYTPDFLVIASDLTVEFHEVKGFWEDDSRVKIKVAAEQFPWFRFIAIRKLSKKLGGGWDVEDF